LLRLWYKKNSKRRAISARLALTIKKQCEENSSPKEGAMEKKWWVVIIFCVFGYCGDLFAIGVVTDGDCTVPMTTRPGGGVAVFGDETAFESDGDSVGDEVVFGPVIAPAKLQSPAQSPEPVSSDRGYIVMFILCVLMLFLFLKFF